MGKEEGLVPNDRSARRSVEVVEDGSGRLAREEISRGQSPVDMVPSELAVQVVRPVHRSLDNRIRGAELGGAVHRLDPNFANHLLIGSHGSIDISPARVSYRDTVEVMAHGVDPAAVGLVVPSIKRARGLEDLVERAAAAHHDVPQHALVDHAVDVTRLR